MLESTCPELFHTVPVLRLELGRELASWAEELRRRLTELTCALQGSVRFALPAPELVPATWLKPNSYRILISGEQRGSGAVYPGLLHASGEPRRLKPLGGKSELDPMRGIPCRWIAPQKRGAAERLGVPLVEASDLLLQHVEQAWRQRVSERAALDQVRDLVHRVQARNPALVQRACRRVGSRVVLEVLANLAAEGFPLHDLPGILDRLGTSAPRSAPVQECTEWLRGRLRASMMRWLAPAGTLEYVAIHPGLQTYLLCQARGGSLSLDQPGVANLLRRLRAATSENGVVLCLPSLRPALRGLLRAYLPSVRLIKTDEIDLSVRLKRTAVLGMQGWDVLGLAYWVYRVGAEQRKKLSTEASEYRRTLQLRQDRTPPAAPRVEPAAALEPPAQDGPLTGVQRAAVFLLECPTWLLRDILARLSPREISALGREMSRLGRHSLRYRDEVLESFPGYDADQPDISRILAQMRRLLGQGACEHPTREVALCLLALGPSYRAVSQPLSRFLEAEEAEQLRAELASLRSVQDAPIGLALSRFIAFYRGSLEQTSPADADAVSARLASTVLREPRRMAAAMMRLWLAPAALRLDDYRHWAAQDPVGAAAWLMRWLRHWTPPGEESAEEQARAAFRHLPGEVAEMLRPYLPEVAWLQLTQGPSSPDWPTAARAWLAEPAGTAPALTWN